jgi:4-alpha-glucanotransferase
MNRSALPRDLVSLARHWRVQTGYFDITGGYREASLEAVMTTLRILGAPIEGPADVGAALRQARLARWSRGAEPVAISWDGKPVEMMLRLPAPRSRTAFSYVLALEDGGELHGGGHLSELHVRRDIRLEGQPHRAIAWHLPHRLPSGYHRLALDCGGARYESLVVSAPSHAYPGTEVAARHWGVFLPLYSLHSRKSWGAGDFSDLEALVDWTSGLGGAVVGTLPLLASFLDEPCQPSPYSPASRLFWNEFYLDVTGLPELARSEEARTILGSADFQLQLDRARENPLVDYRQLMALKRKLLEILAEQFWRDDTPRRADFQRFLEAKPLASPYARFRATMEARRATWPLWPAALRGGAIASSDYAEENWRYHLYVQWQAQEQLRQLSAKARSTGLGLYLDMPLGAQTDSFDVFHYQNLFALGASAGAPPDDFFSEGQDWGLPPLHPERIRETGYQYLIESLRHQLQMAGLLRLDHVMQFHRLFFVPHDHPAAEGVYVHYRAEEMYAILTLESHRHRSWLIGENLGTVPGYVNRAMQRHRLLRMYVLQFECRPDPENALAAPPEHAVASLNTHDTATFAAFFQALDIDERVALGLLEEREADGERERRGRLWACLSWFLAGRGLLERDDLPSLLRAALRYLSQSQARLLLVNLEDLWLETAPQNVPGVGEARPSFRRRARLGREAFCQTAGVLETIDQIRSFR